jgi:hypothetical protein
VGAQVPPYGAQFNWKSGSTLPYNGSFSSFGPGGRISHSVATTFDGSGFYVYGGYAYLSQGTYPYRYSVPSLMTCSHSLTHRCLSFNGRFVVLL